MSIKKWKPLLFSSNWTLFKDDLTANSKRTLCIKYIFSQDIKKKHMKSSNNYIIFLLSKRSEQRAIVIGNGYIILPKDKHKQTSKIATEWGFMACKFSPSLLIYLCLRLHNKFLLKERTVGRHWDSNVKALHWKTKSLK